MRTGDSLSGLEEICVESELSPPEDTRGRDEFSQRCARLFREHNETLLGLLSKKLRSPDEAKDVAQQAYVRLFSLDQPGTISHLRGFLFKIALNIARDRLRERFRRERDAHSVLLHFESVEAPSAERECIEAEDRERLREAVAQLPPKCRLAFTLVEFDGESYAEVAASLDVKVNTVYQLVKRAYEHLALVLSQGSARRGPT